MKLIEEITSHEYCIIDTDYGHFEHNILDDDEEYQKIEFLCERTMSDLKKMQDELDIYAWELIQQVDKYWEDIETIYEYSAVTEDGEEIRILVPDMW